MGRYPSHLVPLSFREFFASRCVALQDVLRHMNAIHTFPQPRRIHASIFAHRGRTRRVREAHPPGTILSYDCMIATIVCVFLFIPVVLFLCSQPLICQRPPAAPAIHGGVHLQARFHVGKTISQAKGVPFFVGTPSAHCHLVVELHP